MLKVFILINTYVCFTFLTSCGTVCEINPNGGGGGGGGGGPLS